jgi:hypothetical protein
MDSIKRREYQKGSTGLKGKGPWGQGYLAARPKKIPFIL